MFRGKDEKAGDARDGGKKLKDEGDLGDVKSGEMKSKGGTEKDLEMAEKAKAEVAELTADLQRTRADFENFRKQVEAQKENERRLAKLATVHKMLPMLDDLDLAIKNYDELKPLAKSLEKTMKELGLAKILSEAGTEFNPDLHDAVMVEGEGENEVIAETLRAGYYYDGEVLRPAMVKVKKG